MDLVSDIVARSCSSVNRVTDQTPSEQRVVDVRITNSRAASLLERNNNNPPISISGGSSSGTSSKQHTNGIKHASSSGCDEQRENLNIKREKQRLKKINSLDSSATFTRPTAVPPDPAPSTSSQQSRYQRPTTRAVEGSERSFKRADSELRSSANARDASFSRQSHNTNMELNQRHHHHHHSQPHPSVSSVDSGSNIRVEHYSRSRGVIQSKQHLEQHQQQNIQHQHQRHHQQQQNASMCQVGAGVKLVNGGGNNIADVQPTLSPPRVKRHQPHCIHHHHHKSHCPQKNNNNNQLPQLNQQATTAVKTIASPVDTTLDSRGALLASACANVDLKNKPGLKYLKSAHGTKTSDKSYLLVQYRHHAADGVGHHQLALDSRSNGRLVVHQSDLNLCTNNSSSSSNNGTTTIANKRTTIKFISQLYFLLHLSAILSLLLHHKNLVTSERKLSTHYNQPQTQQTPTTTGEFKYSYLNTIVCM